MNKKDFEFHNTYNTREANNDNLLKLNTSLMCNYYINREIKLFNQLPDNIKLIDNDIKLKLMTKKLYMQSFCNVD